ncbi:hypothetical protein IGI37_001970 [Enterococcus sp. AZ194]|uniref:hypothetical protein n=1 Tax=Enterococcus sp. AZ194 TaxID=2774629 RepID=UPI003F1FA5B3
MNNKKNTQATLLLPMFKRIFPLLLSIVFAIAITAPFISKNFIFSHDDFAFHRMRLEGYYQAVSHGNFFPKIFPEMANGFGYATDLFYPSLFLLPYVLLRIVGFSFIHSYYGYMFLITMATFLVAYYAINKLFKNRQIAYLFAAIYTTGTYRLLDQFIRGALGETLAFIFLPLVLLGIAQVFITKETKWASLAIGMTCLIYSHMITALIVTTSIAVFVLYQWLTHQLSKQVLLTFLKAVGVSFALSAFVLLPVLEQNHYLNFNYLANKNIWSTGLHFSPADLVINSLANDANNWQNLKPNIGTLLIVFVLATPMFFKMLTKKNKVLLLIGIGYSILATNLFPWVVLKTSFLAFIQLPWRILTLSTLFLSLSLSLLVYSLRNRASSYWYATILLLVFSFGYTNNIIFNFESNNVDRIDNKTYETYALSSIGGGLEYLPVATDYEKIKQENPASYSSKDFQVIQKKATFNHFEYDVVSTIDDEFIPLPKICYVGYSVKAGDHALDMREKDGLLSVRVPKGLSKITLDYVGTPLQKVTLFISLLSWAVLTAYFLGDFFIAKFKQGKTAPSE